MIRLMNEFSYFVLDYFGSSSVITKDMLQEINSNRNG